MQQAPEQEGAPDQAIENDHQHGEHGIARERRIGVAGQHDGGDQRDLDADHGDGQDQRAIGLSQDRRQPVRVANDAEGRPQQNGEDPGEEESRDHGIAQLDQPGIAMELKDRQSDPTDEKRAFSAEARQQGNGPRLGLVGAHGLPPIRCSARASSLSSPAKSTPHRSGVPIGSEKCYSSRQSRS